MAEQGLESQWTTTVHHATDEMGCCYVLVVVGSAIARRALNVGGGICWTGFSCRPRPNAAAFGTLFWARATRACRASLTGRVVIVSSTLGLCSQSRLRL